MSIKLNIKFPKDRDEALAVSGGCWVTFYESQDYKDQQITLNGPCEYSKLNNLPNSNNEDWGDQFDSLRTGPSAWVRIYNDENYKDDSYTFGPGSNIRQLPKGDDVDSLKIFGYNPER
ncbi:hypothetical protein HH214_12500 [Mucilaginibacter robiniae]|uniref:Calcium-dependent cell adhesion molecule N-terminal domain-containing protein n=1 Tax=Mucilaginibacter robiniae TaxID=2728022 RepID=A0A7L5E0T8_9SPHI|nr:beta/gamma crystallin domain-containing protein [Mucilaginibacter robiniae]QJD96641.1 hypothetical protein HH214_12500 [Mucilaginibacter robiniae]